MAKKNKPDRRCTSCNRAFAVNCPPGPIPLGHPQISDHGYLMCGLCLKRMFDHCPACKSDKDDTGPQILKYPQVDSEGYAFLVPVLSGPL